MATLTRETMPKKETKETTPDDLFSKKREKQVLAVVREFLNNCIDSADDDEVFAEGDQIGKLTIVATLGEDMDSEQPTLLIDVASEGPVETF